MATHWSERAPWKELIRVTFVPAAAVVLCIVLPIMLVVTPVLIVYGIVEMRIARAVGLSTRGYFGGRRIGNKWIYELRFGDSLRALKLDVVNTEPGGWDMFFPMEAHWRASVPDWAAERREEISHRIAERYRRKRFHYPSDLVSS